MQSKHYYPQSHGMRYFRIKMCASHCVQLQQCNVRNIALILRNAVMETRLMISQHSWCTGIGPWLLIYDLRWHIIITESSQTTLFMSWAAVQGNIVIFFSYEVKKCWIVVSKFHLQAFERHCIWKTLSANIQTSLIRELKNKTKKNQHLPVALTQVTFYWLVCSAIDKRGLLGGPELVCIRLLPEANRKEIFYEYTGKSRKNTEHTHRCKHMDPRSSDYWSFEGFFLLP